MMIIEEEYYLMEMELISIFFFIIKSITANKKIHFLWQLNFYINRWNKEIFSILLLFTLPNKNRICRFFLLKL